jgi:rhodanese-related sulfurtransferase
MKQVTAAELRDWIVTGKDFLLVDIRELWERELFNIGGTHIPMAELPTRVGEFSADKDIILYCEKGIRSVIAIQRMEAKGYNNLYNLAGGMKAWKESL